MQQPSLEKLTDIIVRYYSLIDDKNPLPSIKTVEDFKMELVETAFMICNGNRQEAADLMGIKRTTFQEMIKRIRKTGRI